MAIAGAGGLLWKEGNDSLFLPEIVERGGRGGRRQRNAQVPKRQTRKVDHERRGVEPR